MRVCKRLPSRLWYFITQTIVCCQFKIYWGSLANFFSSDSYDSSFAEWIASPSELQYPTFCSLYFLYSKTRDIVPLLPKTLCALYDMAMDEKNKREPVIKAVISILDLMLNMPYAFDKILPGQWARVLFLRLIQVPPLDDFEEHRSYLLRSLLIRKFFNHSVVTRQIAHFRLKTQFVLSFANFLYPTCTSLSLRFLQLFWRVISVMFAVY